MCREMTRRHLAYLAIQQTELEVRDRFAGHARNHAFKLRDGPIRVSLVLVIDPEIEPGVRQRRILALHLLQTLDCFFFPPLHPEQRERVVQFVARGIGRDFKRLLKLPNCVLLGGGILIERFAEIAVPVEQILIARLGTRRRQQQCKCDKAQLPMFPAGPVHCCILPET